MGGRTTEMRVTGSEGSGLTRRATGAEPSRAQRSGSAPSSIRHRGFMTGCFPSHAEFTEASAAQSWSQGAASERRIRVDLEQTPGYNGVAPVASECRIRPDSALPDYSVPEHGSAPGGRDPRSGLRVCFPVCNS